MATVRAPNQDFTLGVAASRITMSGLIPLAQVRSVVVVPSRGRIPQPQPSVLTLGGGDGSVPTRGFGYGTAG